MFKKQIVNIEVLGTKLTITTYSKLLSLVTTKIKSECNYICVASVHSLMESLTNSSLQRGMNKSLATTTDGMPLVWIARLFLKRKVYRVYGPDLMLKMCKLAEKRRYKVFLLGGFNGLSVQLKANLIKKFPKIRIVGVKEVPIRPIPKQENKLLIAHLKSLKPDIVFVGLGCPFQEKWMIENHNHFTSGVLVGVGAAFDFISGRVNQAPIWMRKTGLEWLFRLFQEPKRLWKRYVIINAQFVFRVVLKYKHIYIVNEKKYKKETPLS